MIKQLLNSVLTKYSQINYLPLLSASANNWCGQQRQIIELLLSTDKSRYFAQPRPIIDYYTSDSLWKIWLFESIQSIHNSLWTWNDKINGISAADTIFIMSSSTSAWLLCLLEGSPQKQNGWTLCFWGWILWKMDNKTIIEFGFRIISWISKFLAHDNDFPAFWLVP